MKIEEEYVIETQFKLEKYLCKWINILELNDWEIHIKFDDSLDSLGKIEVRGCSRQALIFMLSHEEYKKRNFAFKWDMEETLVHELTHIYFQDFLWAVMEENSYISRVEYFENVVVESLARVLVKQERSKYAISRKA